MLHRDIICTTKQQAKGLLTALSRDPSLTKVTHKLTISSNSVSADEAESGYDVPEHEPTSHLQAHQLLSVLPNLRELTIQHADNLACLVARPTTELSALGHVEVLRLVGPGECSWNDLVRIVRVAAKLRVLTVTKLTDTPAQTAEVVTGLGPVEAAAVDDDERDDLFHFLESISAEEAATASGPNTLHRVAGPCERVRLDRSGYSSPDHNTAEEDVIEPDSDHESINWLQFSPSFSAAIGSSLAIGPRDSIPNTIALTSASASASAPASGNDPLAAETGNVPGTHDAELPNRLAIRSLTLSAPTLTDDHFVALVTATQSSLTALHVLGCTSVTRPGLLRAFRHLGALEELELHSCEFEWGDVVPPVANQHVPRVVRRHPAGGQANLAQTFNWTGRLVPPTPPPPPRATSQWANTGLGVGAAGGGGGGNANPLGVVALGVARQHNHLPHLTQLMRGIRAPPPNGLGLAAPMAVLPLALPLALPPLAVPRSLSEDQLLHPLDYLPTFCPFLHWLSASSDDLGSPRVLRQLARLPLACLQLGFVTPRLDARDVAEDLFERVPEGGGRFESLYVNRRMRWSKWMLREVRDECERKGILFGADEVSEAGLEVGLGI